MRSDLKYVRGDGVAPGSDQGRRCEYNTRYIISYFHHLKLKLFAELGRMPEALIQFASI